MSRDVCEYAEYSENRKACIYLIVRCREVYKL